MVTSDISSASVIISVPVTIPIGMVIVVMAAMVIVVVRTAPIPIVPRIAPAIAVPIVPVPVIPVPIVSIPRIIPCKAVIIVRRIPIVVEVRGTVAVVSISRSKGIIEVIIIVSRIELTVVKQGESQRAVNLVILESCRFILRNNQGIHTGS